MDYNHIKNYLNKIKNIVFLEEEKYNIISNIIEEVIKIKIEIKNIKIKKTEIYIKTSPFIKSEILIKKEIIIKKINFKIKDIYFKDIK